MILIIICFIFIRFWSVTIELKLFNNDAILFIVLFFVNLIVVVAISPHNRHFQVLWYKKSYQDN